MSIKQKALFLLTATAFGYLGYQIYGLMKDDMMDSVLPFETANAAELVQTPGISHRPLLTPEQKSYLHMVNQYELAKMKRRLLEEKAAIAAAERRIALLNEETREINARFENPQVEARNAIGENPIVVKEKVPPLIKAIAEPPHHYTIQLIGSYHSDVVENLAIGNDLGERAKQVSVMKNGKPWYVLLYGRYSTRDAAEIALRKLPADLTSENPQIRRIASLHDNIQRR